MRGKAIEYSDEEIHWLKENHKLPLGEYHEMFLKEFNRKDIAKEHLHALRKRKGWKTGRTGQFDKGSKPWNTGTKGVCKPNSGSFTSKPRPENRVDIGYQRIDKKHGYIWEKVEHPNKFRLKHQLVWEEHNGKIPAGMVLWFIDGNRQNVSIDNLELIKKTEQVRRNKLKLNQQPEEIQDTLKLVAKMQVSISEKSNKE